MKRTSFLKMVITVGCILLLNSLPYGCSEFARVVVDHPNCCPTEKKNLEDAEKALKEAIEKEKPFLLAEEKARAERTAAEKAEADCRAANPVNPANACRELITETGQAGTRLNTAINNHKVTKAARESAEKKKAEAEHALTKCKEVNHCE